MGMRLPAHFGGRVIVLPPRELVDPLVEITPNHWYWLAEFHDDGAGPTAIFPWTPPAELSSRFVVARLLWCWDNDGVGIKRLLLENTCGLATCINPRHWRYANDPADKAYTLGQVVDGGVEAKLLEYPHGLAGRAATVHINPTDTNYTMCGASTRRLITTRKTVITCDDCVKEWLGYGRPLVEVETS